jgi:hypothetical protein
MLKSKNLLNKLNTFKQPFNFKTTKLASPLFKYQLNTHTERTTQFPEGTKYKSDDYKLLKIRDFPQELTPEQKLSYKKFQIYRYDPSQDQEEYVNYYVNLKECGPMYLDALVKIKDTIDPTLVFRR